MPAHLVRIATVVGLSIACGAGAAAQTGAPAAAKPRVSDTFFGTATYRLWEGEAPGAQGAEDGDVPTLTVFECIPARETGRPS
jgi:hypothetical protein